VPLRILIAPDKFKGTISAAQAAQAMARGWAAARPRDRLQLVPISDGGDGFGETLAQILKAQPRSVQTVDAAGQPIEAVWWWVAKTRTAVIESARVIGLAMLPPRKRRPFKLGSFGLGAVLQAAGEAGAHHCLIGIGGSATNDGGFGLARSLGWTFWGRDGDRIEQWTELHRIARVQSPRTRLLLPKVTVAADVKNVLLGRLGATRTFGPQKGLSASELRPAERQLQALANVKNKPQWRKHALKPGSGAAGGLGFGLNVFLGARLCPGFDVFAQHSGLDALMRDADVVITGEGLLDRSSFMGKGVGQLADRCQQRGLPCVVIAGDVRLAGTARRAFHEIISLTRLGGRRSIRAQTARWLQHAAQQAARSFGNPS
jgi:glycerate kinase